MPLPTPRKGEKHDKWDDRCMANKTMKSDFPDRKQRYAVCQTQWRKKRGGKKPATSQNQEEQMEAKRQIPAAAFSFGVPDEAFQLEDNDGTDQQRAKMHALTGKPLMHWYWRTIVFDLAGLKPLKSKIAGLVSHDTDKRASVWDKFEVKDDGLHLEGYFLDTQFGKEVLADAQAGFPWQGSIHFDPSVTRMEEVGANATAKVNGKTVKGPAYIVRETKVDEVSWCVHGVDRGTSGTALADASEQVEVTVTSAGKEPEMAFEDITDEQRRDIALEYVDGLSADELAEVPGVAALRLGAQEEARTAEKDRVKMCADAFEADPAFALKVYLDGTDIKDARIENAEARAKLAEDKAAEAQRLVAGADQGAAGSDFSDSEEAERNRKEKAKQDAGGEDDPVVKFEARVAEGVESGLSEGQATKQVVHEDPELHAAYIAAKNAK